MSGPNAPAHLALPIADRLRATPAPWEVYAERSRRYEIHLNGTHVELVRGPITLEGYGLRVFRPHGAETSVGYQASTDASEEGVRATLADAEEVARFSQFPAHEPELPAGRPASSGVRIVDPALWADPSGSLDSYVAALLAALEGKKGVAPSFGSVKATLSEVSIANSAGLDCAYAQTSVETEVAIKAFGGPEGRPPGEYWVTGLARRLEPDTLPALTRDWSRYAEDARRAKAPPTGEMPVVLPAEVAEGVVPIVVGFKFSAAALLRDLAFPTGTRVGADGLQLHDDGTLDWAVASTPVDDEGTPKGSREIVSGGRVSDLLYDVLHARALKASSTGSALRSSAMDPSVRSGWGKFRYRPTPRASTIVIPPGTGGTDAELVEQVDEGLWVQQIGWAQPEPISGMFGGEIRIGYRIHHGKIAEPVRGGTVGGIVMGPEGAASLFTGLSAAGSKAQLLAGLSSPTLLVRSLAVSGESGPATAAP
ncbi:MAG: TldD/PmbA family protein [Thermoplasmata archaeon]